MFKRGVELGKSPRRAVRCTLHVHMHEVDVHKSEHSVNLHNPSAEEHVHKTVFGFCSEWGVALGTLERERCVLSLHVSLASFFRLVSI